MAISAPRTEVMPRARAGGTQRSTDTVSRRATDNGARGNNRRATAAATSKPTPNPRVWPIASRTVRPLTSSSSTNQPAIETSFSATNRRGDTGVSNSNPRSLL